MKKFHFALLLATLMVLGTSCKPKQSAYKQVYEAAKEKEMQQTASQPSTVVKDASPLPPVEVSVRKEKVEPVYPTDAAGLRRYSVVIASLSVKLNAESLKSRMENEGHQVILAQNEQGMYRVAECPELLPLFETALPAQVCGHTEPHVLCISGCSNNNQQQEYGRSFQQEG